MAPSHVRVAVRPHVKQLTGESAGQPLSSEIKNVRRPILFNPGEGNNVNTVKARCGRLRRSRRT